MQVELSHVSVGFSLQGSAIRCSLKVGPDNSRDGWRGVVDTYYASSVLSKEDAERLRTMLRTIDLFSKVHISVINGRRRLDFSCEAPTESLQMVASIAEHLRRKSAHVGPPSFFYASDVIATKCLVQISFAGEQYEPDTYYVQLRGNVLPDWPVYAGQLFRRGLCRAAKLLYSGESEVPIGVWLQLHSKQRSMTLDTKLLSVAAVCFEVSRSERS